MLTTARGVSLGLGKINLGQLENQARQRAAFATAKTNAVAATDECAKPKFIVKKHVDKKVSVSIPYKWLLHSFRLFQVLYKRYT